MWGKLRSAFIAAKKRRKTKSGQAAIQIPAWKFENEMSFLLPFLENRETITNIHSTEITETPDRSMSQADREESELFPELLEDERNESVENETHESRRSESSDSRSSSRNEPPKFRKRPNPAQEIVDIMKQNTAARQNRSTEMQKLPKELDEVEMFYLSMAKTVKRLPKIEQAKIRSKFCYIVSQAEIEMIQQNPTPPSYTLYSSITSPNSIPTQSVSQTSTLAPLNPTPPSCTPYSSVISPNSTTPSISQSSTLTPLNPPPSASTSTFFSDFTPTSPQTPFTFQYYF